MQEYIRVTVEEYEGLKKGFCSSLKKCKEQKLDSDCVWKEYKLRELCEDVRQYDWEAYDVSLEILQILNEGDK